MSQKPGSLLSLTLRIVLAAAVGCAASFHSVLSAPVPIWAVFNSENSDLPNDTVFALALSQDGSLWAGTDGGLARLEKDGHWQTYSEANTNGGLPSDVVRALALGPDGSLWAGTNVGGVARLDKDGHWQTYSKANTNGGLPSDDVLALALSPDGSLWAGTNGGGLARLDKDGHWQTYSKANTNGGLPGRRRSCVGARPGRLALGRSRRRPCSARQGRPLGTARPTPTAACQTTPFARWRSGPDGSLWAGTVVGGLARLDKDGHWQTYSKVSTNGGLPSDGVPALAFGPDGSLWVGTNGGLARLEKDGHWQTYSEANTNGGLPERLRSCAGARPGRLALGRNQRRPGAARQGRPLADRQQGQHQRRPTKRRR